MSDLDLDIHKYCFDDSQTTFDGDNLDKKATMIFVLKTEGDVKGFCYDENDLETYIEHNKNKEFFRIHVHIRINEALLLYNTFFLQKEEDQRGWYTPIPIHRSQLINGDITVGNPHDFLPSLTDYQLNVKFLMAVEEGNVELVRYLVERGGVNVNTKNGKALMIAKAKGYTGLVKYLLEVGAVGVIDHDEFMRAVKYGNIDRIKSLVEQGADIHAENEEALRFVSKNGNIDVVKYLVDNGADINAQDNYALIWASLSGYIGIVKYLVEHGANIHAEGNKALLLASKYGKLDVLK